MHVLPTEDWDTSLQDVVADMRGSPINVHKLMANNPELLRAWWSFRMHMVSGGSLEQRDCELVILRVATHVKTWYEWAAHVVRGIRAGLSEEEIERVIDGPSAVGWPVRDALLLQAVDELFKSRAITPQTLEKLGEHYSAQNILDLIALQGLYISIACMIGTWEIEVEESVASKLPPQFTRAAFEARVNA